MKKEDIKKDLAKKDLRDELNGIAKRRGRGRTPEEQKEIYAKYHKNKSIVFKREKGNHNTLILFPSVNDESLKKDYYNMGGNSAFIYVHDIAKKIGRTAKLRPDMDHGDVKFYDGVCSIEGLEKFTEKMEKLGAERFKVTGTEIIVFKLPREYTDEEIRSMRNREQEKLTNLIR